MAHAWHDLDIGSDSPDLFNAFIEISMGSKVKYELDKATGLLRVDRILSSSTVFPYNYGFIPQTYAEDKDPLDIIVLSQVEVVPGSVVRAKPIDVLHTIDQGLLDYKIVSVLADDPEWKDFKRIQDLPRHIPLEIEAFFQDYKKLEGKEVIVKGYEGIERAKEIVVQAQKDYKTFRERFTPSQA